MQRLTIFRSSLPFHLRRAFVPLGLAAGLCAVAFAPLRAAAVYTPQPQAVVPANLSTIPTTAAEALPTLPQRLTSWLYSVQRSVEQSAVSSPHSRS